MWNIIKYAKNSSVCSTETIGRKYARKELEKKTDKHKRAEKYQILRREFDLCTGSLSRKDLWNKPAVIQ